MNHSRVDRRRQQTYRCAIHGHSRLEIEGRRWYARPAIFLIRYGRPS